MIARPNPLASLHPAFQQAFAPFVLASEAQRIAFDLARNADKNADGPALRNQQRAQRLQEQRNSEGWI